LPRGVPKAGHRNRIQKQDRYLDLATTVAVSKETDQEIEARLTDRFEILELLSKAVTTGDVRALVVSGPPGLGKSYTVETAMHEWDPSGTNYEIVRGFARATGLFRLLFQYRNKGQVIVFDDADSIFQDDVALNLLKAVCDTTERRVVGWHSEGILINEETAERIPKTFVFEGTIVFITNLDWDALIEKNHKFSPHLAAMMSRSLYIDLGMKSRRDYIIRMKQVIKKGMLDHLSFYEKNDVIRFIDEYSDKLRECSLRIAIKIAQLRKSDPKNWERIAKLTCLKHVA
jgi:hypothetical protein